MTPSVNHCSNCARNKIDRPCYQWQRAGEPEVMLNCPRYVSVEP